MNLAFYTGATGLGAFQGALNIVGNNIANSNTIGYKPETVSFENLLYTHMYVNAESEPLVGTGVKSQSNGITFGTSAYRTTENALDFAIVGDGFFVIEKNGNTTYTRAGAFQMGSDGTGNYYLCTTDGSYVLDSTGNRIQIEQDPETGNYIHDGIAGKIAVVQFENQQALETLSGNRFAQTDESGEPVILNEENHPVRSRILEQSGTVMASEMTNMILAQRGFQMSSKVVQTADEIEDIVNNLRK